MHGAHQLVLALRSTQLGVRFNRRPVLQPLCCRRPLHHAVVGETPASNRSLSQRHRQLLPCGCDSVLRYHPRPSRGRNLDQFSNTQDKVDREAQVVGSLYRDVNSFPEPLRTTLDNDVRAYVREVVDVSWPLQRKGVTPYSSGLKLEQFQADLLLFEPKTEREKIVTAQAYQVFNNLVEARRGRLESVSSGMPASLWSLVILGGLITLTATLFFDTPSFRMHLWMSILLGTLVGLMVFLVATLDNPFRGKVSIGPGSLERVYQQLMEQHVSAADGALSRRAVATEGGSR